MFGKLRRSSRISQANKNHNSAGKDEQYSPVTSVDMAVGAQSAMPRSLETVLDGNKGPSFAGLDDYLQQRDEVVSREAALAFDHVCRVNAPDIEVRANHVLLAVKRHDKETIYDAAPSRSGYGGQMHRRFMGDHFLYNAELIERTLLFRIAREMPKGGHLHIHFNANLAPEVLINIAKKMPRMFITSDIPLVGVGEDQNSPGYYQMFDRCKIQFSILTPEKEMPGNLFDPNYPSRGTMRFQDFLREFESHFRRGPEGSRADEWLRSKLVFHEEEAYNWLQTPEGAWEKFNARTQMMKGLFNYKSAYQEYTYHCLKEFRDDNIQYAEIRPNFMKTNQLWTDDGAQQIDNEGIMNIIITEYNRFQQDYPGSVFGLKIIYCTPRSFSKDAVRYSLKECLAFKKRWPEWIAGFDLVGEESKGFPLKQFIPELIEFKKNCEAENVDIPFLFHCGETLDMGSDTDGNLVDALLLGAKRIGHGFALPRHPYIMEQMKKHGVCVELCPISNEVLGLTPRIGGHALYSLLANNVHCSVSTDNGTIFRSRLSHDFYQVFVGRADMTLHGWRQLIEWSIEHACMEDPLRTKVKEEWAWRWTKFCEWVIQEYEHLVDDTGGASL
ncbi:hypothetical protein VTK73DRAFT_3039 [Phialemonium thermophilum]|uniref:Adenosine deaminase domain-containing protein n=1 Tax=Phialemonium thermophilum TaxID=223376 RepID=A0ABR3X1C5_9PEZI